MILAEIIDSLDAMDADEVREVHELLAARFGFGDTACGSREPRRPVAPVLRGRG